MHYIESDTVIFVAALALAGWIFWLHHRRRQQQSEIQQIRLSLARQALEKFDSSPEFLEFMQSKEGQAMLFDGESAASGQTRPWLRHFQAGILVICIGGGFLAGAYCFPVSPDAELREVQVLVLLSGTVMISAGAGLTVAALAGSLWERWFRRPGIGRR